MNKASGRLDAGRPMRAGERLYEADRRRSRLAETSIES
jgi:hypothetical protein